MMEESAHQNQGRGPTVSLEAPARKQQELPWEENGGCRCLEGSVSERVQLPSCTYKNISVCLP